MTHHHKVIDGRCVDCGMTVLDIREQQRARRNESKRRLRKERRKV